MTDLLAQPLKLPCGATLPNRLCKAAMTEGLADARLRATTRHDNLYRQWSEGGAGLLLTGNVQIDRRVLERPGNVAIDLSTPGPAGPTLKAGSSLDSESRERLVRWAKAGTVAGNHLWMQIAHAGRQSPRYVTMTPLAPSEVQLEIVGNYGKPRAITEAEILDFIQRFARVAAIARETGFTGVQVHSAHGYLLSSWLSSHTNRRTDAWGGSLENRARFLLETLKAVRKSVGNDFPVGVKLNSDDFRKGGFTHEECLKVVGMLNGAQIDLLEISGGTYEQPRLLGFDIHTNTAQPQRESTKKREAYFLDYAAAIRKVAKMPLMVTGGFRTRAGMEAPLAAGECDVIGLGRPLCSHTDLPKQLLARRIDELPRHEKTLMLKPSGWLSPTSPLLLFRVLNGFGAQAWYYIQLFRLADHGRIQQGLGIISAFFRYQADEYWKALRMKWARRSSRVAA